MRICGIADEDCARWMVQGKSEDSLGFERRRKRADRRLSQRGNVGKHDSVAGALAESGEGCGKLGDCTEGISNTW